MFTPKPQITRLEDRTVPAVVTTAEFVDPVADATTPPADTDVVVTTTGDEAAAGDAVPDPVPPTTGSEVPAPVATGLDPVGSVRGVVFADLNGDGKRDANEPGVGGVTVTVDREGDGLVEFTALTAADGSFIIANVADGLVRVAVVSPVNYRPSGDAAATVFVSAASPQDPLSVGVRPTTALSGKVTLAATGTALAGVTVTLDRDTAGATPVTATTDKTGTYLFANVPTGPHTITVDAPAGTQFLTADGSGKLTPTVTLSNLNTGGVQTGLDISIQYTGGATGGVYTDVDRNGKFDPTIDQARTPGRIEVDLFNAGEPVTVTAAVTPDGGFTVGGLPDGKHTLIVSLPGATTGPIRLPVTVADGELTATTPVGFAPAPTTAVGGSLAVGSGAGPTVQEYSFTTNPDGSLTARPGRVTTTTGVAGSRAILADFTGDGTADLITATGPGEAAVIRVYDGQTGAEIASFAGFEASFTGGVNLSAGDFNGDGKADIVAAADVGGGPRVRVFNAAQFQGTADPAQGKLLADFFAIEDKRFRGGSRVAVGDLNADGMADLVVSAGVGGGPRVAIFDGKSIAPGQAPRKLVADFFAYEQQLRNGAVVSVGDVNGDGFADLVTGAGAGGAPRVTVFSGVDIAANRGSKSTRIADFYVNGDAASRGGTVVTVKDLDSDGRADIVAGNGPRAYVFTAKSVTANYLNPRPEGPRSGAELFAFGEVGGINLG